MQFYNLRARYYDQSNGRFNALDPWEGNEEDPQSLHKYAYGHSTPTNGADPTGELFEGLIGFLQTLSISAYIRGVQFLAGHSLIAGVLGLALGLIIPEEVSNSLQASGFPPFQGLSALQKGEVRLLKFFVNNRVTQWIYKNFKKFGTQGGELGRLLGESFEEFIGRMLKGASGQPPTSTGKLRGDFSWRGWLIEVTTSISLDKRKQKQLKALGDQAIQKGETLVYFFLERPTRGTVKMIEKVGGGVVYFFER